MSLGQDVCKIAPHIADACLHHKGEAKAGIKGVYNHATYLDEKRAALDCWGNYIDNLLNPAAPDNVVHIRRA